MEFNTWQLNRVKRKGMHPTMNTRNGEEFHGLNKYYGFYSVKKMPNFSLSAWYLRKAEQCNARIKFCLKNNINIQTDLIYQFLVKETIPREALTENYINRRGEITKANLVFHIKSHKSLDDLIKNLKKVDPSIQYCGIVTEAQNITTVNTKQTFIK